MSHCLLDLGPASLCVHPFFSGASLTVLSRITGKRNFEKCHNLPSVALRAFSLFITTYSDSWEVGCSILTC